MRDNQGTAFSRFIKKIPEILPRRKDLRTIGSFEDLQNPGGSSSKEIPSQIAAPHRQGPLENLLGANAKEYGDILYNDKYQSLRESLAVLAERIAQTAELKRTGQNEAAADAAYQAGDHFQENTLPILKTYSENALSSSINRAICWPLLGKIAGFFVQHGEPDAAIRSVEVATRLALNTHLEPEDNKTFGIMWAAFINKLPTTDLIERAIASMEDCVQEKDSGSFSEVIKRVKADHYVPNAPRLHKDFQGFPHNPL